MFRRCRRRRGGTIFLWFTVWESAFGGIILMGPPKAFWLVSLYIIIYHYTGISFLCIKKVCRFGIIGNMISWIFSDEINYSP